MDPKRLIEIKERCRYSNGTFSGLSEEEAEELFDHIERLHKSHDALDVQLTKVNLQVHELQEKSDRLKLALEHNEMIRQDEKKGAELQIGALRRALYAECRGESCGPECAGGGYRKCSGCDRRAKMAYGEGWGQECDHKGQRYAGFTGKAPICLKCGALLDASP